MTWARCSWLGGALRLLPPNPQKIDPHADAGRKSHREDRIEEVVQPTQQANLDFLPSGKLPSSAMGILNSQQMRDFIKMIRTKYDYVLFDSPPLIGVSDATVLASGVDMTLLVIQYRKYPQSLALR